MLKAFAVLIADETYGGQVYSMTPNADWKEVTGDASNPNLITAEKYKELVDAHVMFKDMDADPYLKSAGIASDWPCGRGCYQSAAGTKIKSKQKGQHRHTHIVLSPRRLVIVIHHSQVC